LYLSYLTESVKKKSTPISSPVQEVKNAGLVFLLQLHGYALNPMLIYDGHPVGMIP
jgi:hypothetical protein